MRRSVVAPALAFLGSIFTLVPLPATAAKAVRASSPAKRGPAQERFTAGRSPGRGLTAAAERRPRTATGRKDDAAVIAPKQTLRRKSVRQDRVAAKQEQERSPAARKSRQSTEVGRRDPGRRATGNAVAAARGRSDKRPPRVARAATRRKYRLAAVRVPRRRLDPNALVLPNRDASPVLNVASRLLGRPYRFGAVGGGSYDCSGLVRTVFLEFGVDLPHSARQQFTLGGRVGRDELEPGDLVFFETYRPGASHVGIYAGEDRFIHAAAGAGRVQVNSLQEAYYAHRYLGARRIAI